ncbi:MAG: precorrin-4 C(11)-methyltransferase [Lachnospiraceae bacterium]|nr:precorrin-4 C(11)-methyltransferase [Lachnospiraceae bacterium]
MVHFVGAGPGSVDLITRRGEELLKKADTVVYAGSLINKDLLKLCRKDCTLYDSALMDLDGIIAVIKESCDAGGEVVRLCSGDPSLYGAIGEHMRRLDELGIDYDVCPGVSSFLAAAAALKTEYMVPELSQSLVITRAPGRTPVPDKETIEYFAKSGCALAIFLSTGLLESVKASLLAGGYSEDDPVVIAYKVSHEDEKLIHCSVGTLCENAEQEGIMNTALIIVGKMLKESDTESRLYAKDFSTLFRTADNED